MINYQKKYLKYKQKYLNQKSIQIAGALGDTKYTVSKKPELLEKIIDPISKSLKSVKDASMRLFRYYNDPPKSDERIHKIIEEKSITNDWFNKTAEQLKRQASDNKNEGVYIQYQDIEISRHALNWRSIHNGHGGDDCWKYSFNKYTLQVKDLIYTEFIDFISRQIKRQLDAQDLIDQESKIQQPITEPDPKKLVSM